MGFFLPLPGPRQFMRAKPFPHPRKSGQRYSLFPFGDVRSPSAHSVRTFSPRKAGERLLPSLSPSTRS